MTQVLTELEFSVEPCGEPFAAVKKLMSQHFDALVVDCDNEQNATLLFKSARNSTSNQTSLAVAIVEGQAGVAKAFRIGANLVLTKPINVEQSKGTLRVARGLLRKGEPAKPASSAPAPGMAAPATPPSAVKPLPKPPAPAKPAAAQPSSISPRPAMPATARPVVNAPSVPSPAGIPVAKANAATPSQTRADTEDASRFIAVSGGDQPKFTVSATAPKPASPIPSPDVPKSAPSFSKMTVGASGAASAPAPAREIEPAQSESANAASAEVKTETDETREPVAKSASTAAAGISDSVPSFTFGGAAVSEPPSGASKKIFLGIVAAMLIIAGAYAGWTYFKGRASQSPVSSAPVNRSSPKTPPASAQPASSQSTTAQPTDAPAQPASQSVTDSQTNAKANAKSIESSTAVVPQAEETASTPAGNSSHISAVNAKSSAAPALTEKNPGPVNPAAAPLVVKGGAVPSIRKPLSTADAAAPNVIGIQAPASGTVLSNIVANDEPAAKPVLQAMRISQGVSQGLIMKRVAPVYPPSALAMRLEGAVDLLATISKEGNITEVKVLKGDPQLSRAAVTAVKQWKYKPYLLDDEPVEIQTQVTVKFNLPR